MSLFFNFFHDSCQQLSTAKHWPYHVPEEGVGGWGGVVGDVTVWTKRSPSCVAVFVLVHGASKARGCKLTECLQACFLCRNARNNVGKRSRWICIWLPPTTCHLCVCVVDNGIPVVTGVWMCVTCTSVSVSELSAYRVLLCSVCFSARPVVGSTPVEQDSSVAGRLLVLRHVKCCCPDWDFIIHLPREKQVRRRVPRHMHVWHCFPHQVLQEYFFFYSSFDGYSDLRHAHALLSSKLLLPWKPLGFSMAKYFFFFF